jgi:hypothetical protein
MLEKNFERKGEERQKGRRKECRQEKSGDDESHCHGTRRSRSGHLDDFAGIRARSGAGFFTQKIGDHAQGFDFFLDANEFFFLLAENFEGIFHGEGS